MLKWLMISIRGLKIPDTSSASCQVASPRYHRREVQCDQKGSPCRSPCSWLGPMERVALGCSKVAMYKSHNTHDVVSPCFMCHAWCRWSLVSYKTWVCYNVVLANRTLTYYATKRSGSKLSVAIYCVPIPRNKWKQSIAPNTKHPPNETVL